MSDPNRGDQFADWVVAHAYLLLALELVIGMLLILWKNGW